MKQKTNILLTCILFIGIGQAQGSDQPSVLARIIGVRCFDRPSYSRLVIELKDSFQYTAKRQGNEIKITFAGVQVPPSYDGTRLQYSSGLLDRVWIDRLQNDSVVVTVLARKNTAFNLRKARQLIGLLLDVSPDSSQPLAQDTVVAAAQSTAIGPPVIQPIETMSVKNPVPVENPQRNEGGGAIVETALIVKTWLKSIAVPGAVDPLLASVAIVLAVAGTGLLLLLFRRLSMRKPKRERAAFNVEFDEAMSMREPPLQADLPEVIRVVEPVMAAERDQDASALGLARKYGRGLGEVNLSINLKARQRYNRWAKKAQRLVEVANDRRDTGKIAKELGIGRGEVDLAMLFHHLKTPTTPREELA